jgi:predicted nucleic acid-binding protein
VILADTSAWIEFLRGTGSALGVRLRELLISDEVATTDAVVMEVLTGARDAADHERLRRLLWRCDFVATEGPRDYESAAEISLACRQAGERIRWLIDCLIASVAIRSDVPILTADADFDTIARHTPLQVVTASGS